MSGARPAGAGAVMADRARGEVQGDTAQAALWRRLEYFPTPPWAARAGGELIQRLDPGPWSCWEPACGEGHMAHGLRDYFEAGVFATDIHRHGGGPACDFLSAAADEWGEVDWIVTNPPFASAAAFVRLGLARARRGVAILARASFLESAGRYGLFFPDGDALAAGACPLTAYAPFIERVPMVLGRWDPGASTATAYAWFVWSKTMRAVGGARVMPIPPGTKARLSRGEDARRWAKAAPAPLLEGGR